MMKIEQEIQFLKNFKQRFTNDRDYRSAIEDMWREGLITPKAYKAITADNTNKLVPKAALGPVSTKRVAKDAIKILEEDPCGHGKKVSYSSSCSGGSNNRC